MVGPKSLSLALVAALLAGCSSSDPSSSNAGAQTSTSTGPDTNLTDALERLGPPERITLYFTASGDLSFDLPSEGTVAIGTPASWPATGLRGAVFELPPTPEALLIVDEDIAVTAFVTSPYPQPTNGAFDFAAQVGSTRSSGLWAFRTAPQPITPPATTQEIRLQLSFDGQRALLVPQGESIKALVLGHMGGESGEPHLRVGGQQASRIELTLRNYTVDPLGGATGTTEESFTGTVTGAFTAPTCDAAPGTTSTTREVTIGPNSVSFDVRLASANGQDVDLDVLDAGRVVAAGHSALGTEAVFLGAETLDGLQGVTVTLKVTACGVGPINYQIEIEQGTGPEPDNGPA